MRNEIINYMVDIEGTEDQLVLVEGEISPTEMVQQYKETGDFLKPIMLRKEATQVYNLKRLHDVVVEAIKKWGGRKVIEYSFKGQPQGIYVFPTSPGLRSQEDLLEFLDKHF